MILNDNDYKRLAAEYSDFIDPFVPYKVDDGEYPSYGLEPFGYTLRLATDGPRTFYVPPNGFVLRVTTVETIRIPYDCLGMIFGKSSYARQGLIVNCTPFEPGWKGKPTITLINPTSNNITLHMGYGIAQLVLLKGSLPHTFYAGRYQDATGVQESKI